MYKILGLSAAFILFACSNTSYAQKWVKCGDTGRENIYKHYSGTLGDKKIALDLRFGFCGGSNYGGSNYYTMGKEGSTLFYIGEPDSFDLNITLRGEEQPENNKLWEDDNYWPDRSKLARWTFKITNDKINGTWASADRKEKRDISLTEDYSKSFAMDLISYSDKVSDGWILYTRPSPAVKTEDAEFITREQLIFLGGTTEQAHNWSEYLRVLKGNDTFGRTMLLPVYNDHGFLVFEKETNKPNSFISRRSYLCLDILNKRRLGLNDIIHADNKKLPQLLETALRKKFNLEKDKKLSTLFHFDKVPVTSNIMLTEQGINFCYDFNEVVIKQDHSRAGEDPIKVFLSYSQLKELLREDFRERLRY